MYQLRGIIDHQTNPAMARSLRNLMGLFQELAGNKKVKRQRRSEMTEEGIEEMDEKIHELLNQNYSSTLEMMVTLEHYFENMDAFGKIKRHRSKRSADLWTCSDLAIIVREYDYVINLLETINTFIQEEILDKFNDQLDDEVRNFVNRTLTVYTEAETQLKTKRGPFVQYQTEGFTALL